MNDLMAAVADLVALVGEEQAANLISDLADTIKEDRRPFDEVAQFLRVDARARGDAADEQQALLALSFSQARAKLADELKEIGAKGGRPSRVQFYVDLYRRAQDKQAALDLARKNLSARSYWRLRKELGL